MSADAAAIRVPDGLLGRRSIDVLSLVPLVAIIALVAVVGVLLWLVLRSEAEQARTKLATDALWVEQTLRFQFSVDGDMLTRLALDEAGGTAEAVLLARARQHLVANPEVLSVVWHDAAGVPVRAVPGLPAAGDTELVQRILQMDTVSARPIFGAARADGTVTMGLRAAAGKGVLTATISLPEMLERHIPWWIAEQYGVVIFDAAGDRLASRMRGITGQSTVDYGISFDPPLPGTELRIYRYVGEGTAAQTLLLSTVAGLSVFAVLALLALYRNTDRRRRAEHRLRAEMAFRRSMEESLTVGLRAKDRQGRILYVNAAFCRMVGLSAEELIGRMPPMPYWSPDRMEETLTRQRQLGDGEVAPQSFETRFRRADGAEIDVQVYEAPLIDPAGRHQGWMGSIIDISEAKAAARLARAQDEHLARTGRLVTLGEMASTLAHELNQPLGAIASYAAGGLNLVEAGQADTPQLRTALEKMSAQARRAGLIIRRIQDFVKKREPQLVALDLTEVAGDAMGLMAGEAREMGLRMALDVPEEAMPPVMADRILIEQVMVNLIRNGLEAMAAGPRSGDQLTLRLHPEGGMLRLDVVDQGPGIPPELADQLYDPFTSTKSQGMGMGLNICRSIVELLHGSLSHAANPGGGTVFSVRLPFAAKAGQDP
jgi:two-component system sensor histidine kinase DctS